MVFLNFFFTYKLVLNIYMLIVLKLTSWGSGWVLQIGIKIRLIRISFLLIKHDKSVTKKRKQTKPSIILQKIIFPIEIMEYMEKYNTSQSAFSSMIFQFLIRFLMYELRISFTYAFLGRQNKIMIRFTIF